MSNKCTTINESNFAAYDASYNKINGRCFDPTTKTLKTIPSLNCKDADLACYDSYKLTTARHKLDTDLQGIYEPQTSTTAGFDSNYQTTMVTSVIWAALGTTLLYYAFTKI